MNFAKFLRASFLQNTSGRRLLELFVFFLILFLKKTTFSMKKTTLKKVVVAEEKLDDSDDIRNLEDLPRHMFNDEECGNLNPKMLDFLKVAFSGWRGGEGQFDSPFIFHRELIQY